MKSSSGLDTVWIYLSGVLIALLIFRFGKMRKIKSQNQKLMNDLFEEPTFSKVYQFISKKEGIRNKAYPDAGGFSIGIGHFIQPNEKELLSKTLTNQEIQNLFIQDLKVVNTALTKVKIPLNEGQKVALASLIFNIGSGAFEKSNLLKKLNANDLTGASLEFPRWNQLTNKAGVKSANPTLTQRRLEEQLIFRTGKI